MEPVTRIALEYPIYALDTLDDDTIIVGGGGGLMKSGIPNACHAINFNEATSKLTTTASISLADAVLSLTSRKGIIYTVMGQGLKFLSYKSDKQKTTLTPNSRRQHDIKVSSSQEQAAVAVSSDGSTLVIASDEGHVVSMKLPRYELKYRGKPHSQGITDLAVTPDGNVVATTGRDNAAYIWEAYSGTIIQKITPIMPPSSRTHICAIRFSSQDPNSIITAESNPRKGGWISVWKKESNQKGGYVSVASIKASNEALTELTVNDTGNLIATSTAEGHLLLFSWNGRYLSPVWSTETKTSWFRSPQSPHVLPITAMKFSSSSSHLFAASADYTITTWPTTKPTNWRKIRSSSFWIVAFLICIIAALIGEDGHLPDPMRNSIEPHLSNLKSIARPIVQGGQAQLSIYADQIHEIAKPHLQKIQGQKSPISDQFSQIQSKGESTLEPAHERTKYHHVSQKDSNQYGETEVEADTFEEQNSAEYHMGSTVSSISDVDQIDKSVDSDMETTIQDPTPDRQEGISESETDDMSSLEKEHTASTVISSTDHLDMEMDINTEHSSGPHQKFTADDNTEHVDSDEASNVERSSKENQSDLIQSESTQYDEEKSVLLNEDEVEPPSSSLEPLAGDSDSSSESIEDDGKEMNNEREIPLPQDSPEFDNLKAVEENRGQLDKEDVLIEEDPRNEGDKETESVQYATIEDEEVTQDMTQNMDKSIGDELVVRDDKTADTLVMNEEEKNLNDSPDLNSEEEGEISMTKPDSILSDELHPDELSVIPVNTMESAGEHAVHSDITDASMAPLDEDDNESEFSSEGNISTDYPSHTDPSTDPLTKKPDDFDEGMVKLNQPIDDKKDEVSKVLLDIVGADENSQAPIMDADTLRDTDSIEKEDYLSEFKSEDSIIDKDILKVCPKPHVWQALSQNRKTYVKTKNAVSTDEYIKSQSSKHEADKTKIQKESLEEHEDQVHIHELNIESEDISNVQDDEISDISWKDTSNNMQTGIEIMDISTDRVEDEYQDKVELNDMAEASASEEMPDEDLASQSQKINNMNLSDIIFEDEVDSQPTAQAQ